MKLENYDERCLYFITAMLLTVGTCMYFVAFPHILLLYPYSAVVI